jgi:hypothetical protein
VPLGDDVGDAVSFAECVTLSVTEPDTESLGIVVGEPETEVEAVDEVLNLTVLVTVTVTEPVNVDEVETEADPVTENDLSLENESCIDGEGVDEGDKRDVIETEGVTEDSAVNVGEELWVCETDAVPVMVRVFTAVAECEGDEEKDMGEDGEFELLEVTDADVVLLKIVDTVFVAHVVREPEGDDVAVLFESVADDVFDGGAEMV